MRSMRLALAVALPVAVLAMPANGRVSDFRLPADQPPPPSDVQGPVAPDVPASRRLGPTPTPTASAAPRPASTPTEAAPPVEVPEALRTRPTIEDTRRTAAEAPAAERAPSLPDAAPIPDSSPVAVPPAAPSGLPRPAETEENPAAESDGSWPWFAAGAAGLLAALGLGAWRLRRRKRPERRVPAPAIERPRLAPSTSSPAPSPAVGAERLQVSLEPLRLSLTLINATLAYRLEIANRGAAALTGLTIGADMISAHASLSREEQLSGPRAEGVPVQRIERLDPGESRVIAGEFRLPLTQVMPIRQGNAALLLPLARFRVEGGGAAPVVRTFVVGQPGQGNALQPFRLDLGPRVYPRLAQHAFA
jgi:hypothetical protein